MAKRFGWYIPEQLVLDITLAGTRPKVWRRVEVHSGLTLEDLHYVIQGVFEWTNSHLYQFLVPEGGKLTQRALARAVRYSNLPPDPFGGFDDEDRPERADEQLVGRVFTPTCKQIVYEYDFGDSWEHVVKLKKRTPGGDQDHVPVCLAGDNAAPLDDMGGVWGFYDFLDALKDETHDRHEDAVEWLGEDFDPTHFDAAAINKRLAAMFKPAPKKPRKPRKKKE